MCTGSNPFIPPTPGKDLKRDCLPRHRRHQRDDHDATKYKNAVGHGGGLPGLEAANGLMLRGMTRQRGACDADADGAPRQHVATAAKSLEDRGLKF
jgi:nitrite reductase (NADH) large subunit